MLKQRVITALILLAVLLPALFSSNPSGFHLIVLLMLTVGAWEWGRLNGLRAVGAIATAVVMLAAVLITWQLGWVTQAHRTLWLVAGAGWVLGSVYLINKSPLRRSTATTPRSGW